MEDKQGINFRRLRLTGWRQFDNIDVELHSRLTIITGANGAGKSSIIKLFSSHFGHNPPFLSVPFLDKSGQYRYSFGTFISLVKRFSPFQRNQANQIGDLTYSNGSTSGITLPSGTGVSYNVSLTSQEKVSGIHIDSHQPVPRYQTVGQIPSSMLTPQHAYKQYNQEHQYHYTGGHSGYSPVYRMKEALIAMAMFGESNSRSPGNPRLKEALDGFVEVLRKMLPPSLGFMDISIRSPEVVIQTRSGEFLLDAASGGVMTLIDFAWRLHLFSLENNSFVVTFDEPENHLHPSMQRSLMGRLLDAFPQAQFIVATHSPFIVSSVKDSFVYVLRYEGADYREIQDVIPETTKSRIVSERLDTINKGGSANAILRDVLGVEATVPEWVVSDIRHIVEKFRRTEITKESLMALRKELGHLGFEDQYPAALAELTRQND
ncbi:MAG: AAA family ATPase [Shinella sp.]|nr:MAG: AAA family ATPase [Shinella sp.]